LIQILVAEQRQHRAGFGGVRADMAADKLIWVRGPIFNQIHPAKITVRRPQSKIGFQSKA